MALVLTEEWLLGEGSGMEFDDASCGLSNPAVEFPLDLPLLSLLIYDFLQLKTNINQFQGIQQTEDLRFSSHVKDTVIPIDRPSLESKHNTSPTNSQPLVLLKRHGLEMATSITLPGLQGYCSR